MKFDIFPIKICVAGRNQEDPKALASIITILPEADEESFNKPDTLPTVNIKLLIDSSLKEDIDYVCSLNWFMDFYAYSGLNKLVNRVNFACSIEVNNATEFDDDTRHILNHMFEDFVNKMKAVVEDTKKHIVIWPKDPIFTVTIPEVDEDEKPAEEPATEGQTIVPEVVEENEPVSE